jgi:hypothetical protein
MKLLVTTSLFVLLVQGQDTHTTVPPTLSPSSDQPPTRTTCTALTTPSPSPTRTYQPCGGRVISPIPCPSMYKCIDDPRRQGCGMACDRPGICVHIDTRQCGGLKGFRCPELPPGPCPEDIGVYFGCYDDPRDSCDPLKGGKDCIGICLKPLTTVDRGEDRS